jgi:hypothetical protein
MKKLEILGKVHHAIKNRKKGSVTQIAEQLNLSRSYLYLLIDELETYGASIRYSRESQCFYYESEFKFKISIEVTDFSKIIGGKRNSFRPRILDGRVSPLYHQVYTWPFHIDRKLPSK